MNWKCNDDIRKVIQSEHGSEQGNHITSENQQKIPLELRLLHLAGMDVLGLKAKNVPS